MGPALSADGTIKAWNQFPRPYHPPHRVFSRLYCRRLPLHSLPRRPARVLPSTPRISTLAGPTTPLAPFASAAVVVEVVSHLPCIPCDGFFNSFAISSYFIESF